MLNLKDDRYFVVLKPQVLHNDEMIDVSLKYQLTLQDLKDQLRGKYYASFRIHLHIWVCGVSSTLSPLYLKEEKKSSPTLTPRNSAAFRTCEIPIFCR